MKQWYALRSKPKKESLAAGLLARAGIDVYLPQAKVHKQTGKPPVVEPFFPRYLFSHLDPLQGEVRLASYTSGIQYVVCFDGQPCPVPDNLILAIQERLARSRGRAPVPELQQGERVVIADGLLHDVEAIFDCELSRDGRVALLIQVLERTWRIELNVGQLRRVT